MGLALSALSALVAVLVASGCGSDDSAAGTEAGDDGSAGTVVAVLGDSITAGSPLWDPDPDARDRIGAALDERSQFEYWAERGDRGLSFRNCGVFGERADEIAGRLAGCAKDADVLIVQGGINNVAQGLPVAAAAADLERTVVAGKDLGLRVAIADVLPWNNGFPTAAPEIDALNRLIAAIAAREDVPLLPFNLTLRDGANPGLMAESLTDDGDHPSVAGYRRLAERAVLPHLPIGPASGGS
jgi:lysophospholipase L1-like esterase